MGNVIDWESMLKNVELADHAPEEHLCDSCEHSLICTIEAEWEGLVYECPYYLKRIVRCEDCDNWDKPFAKGSKRRGNLVAPCSVWSCFENGTTTCTPWDGFCNYGERRESE